jgi:hypothetical protein
VDSQLADAGPQANRRLARARGGRRLMRLITTITTNRSPARADSGGAVILMRGSRHAKNNNCRVAAQA